MFPEVGPLHPESRVSLEHLDELASRAKMLSDEDRNRQGLGDDVQQLSKRRRSAEGCSDHDDAIRRGVSRERGDCVSNDATTRARNVRSGHPST
jgi:hypothetical protein